MKKRRQTGSTQAGDTRHVSNLGMSFCPLPGHRCPIPSTATFSPHIPPIPRSAPLVQSQQALPPAQPRHSLTVRQQRVRVMPLFPLTRTVFCHTCTVALRSFFGREKKGGLLLVRVVPDNGRHTSVYGITGSSTPTRCIWGAEQLLSLLMPSHLWWSRGQAPMKWCVSERCIATDVSGQVLPDVAWKRAVTVSTLVSSIS